MSTKQFPLRALRWGHIYYLFFLLLLQSPITAAEENTSDSSSSPTSQKKSDSRIFVFGGYGLFSGPASSSFAGAKEYSGGMAIEDKQGFLRLYASIQTDVMPETSLKLGNADTPSALKYFAFKLGAGLRVFPINIKTRGGLDPFLSAGGSFSRGSVDVSPKTDELDTYFRPNLYGYELCVGFDLKSSRSSRPVIRPRFCYSAEQGSFSNLSGFALTRTEFQLGIGF